MISYVGMRGRINSATDVDPTVTVIVGGPQNTLYGVNSIAGVINVVTRQPGETPRYGVAVEGSIGPEFDGSMKLSGSVSGLLVSEKLFGGLALSSAGRAGARFD